MVWVTYVCCGKGVGGEIVRMEARTRFKALPPGRRSFHMLELDKGQQDVDSEREG